MGEVWWLWWDFGPSRRPVDQAWDEGVIEGEDDGCGRAGEGAVTGGVAFELGGVFVALGGFKGGVGAGALLGGLEVDDPGVGVAGGEGAGGGEEGAVDAQGGCEG